MIVSPTKVCPRWFNHSIQHWLPAFDYIPFKLKIQKEGFHKIWLASKLLMLSPTPGTQNWFIASLSWMQFVNNVLTLSGQHYVIGKWTYIKAIKRHHYYYYYYYCTVFYQLSLKFTVIYWLSSCLHVDQTLPVQQQCSLRQWVNAGTIGRFILIWTHDFS